MSIGDTARHHGRRGFITEYVQDPPLAAIYGEVVRGLTPLNAPEFYSNVMLVE